MKLITLVGIIGFTVAVKSECDVNSGSLASCIESSQKSISACNDQTCQCQAMSNQIDCFKSCNEEESAMQVKAEQVSKMQSQCSSQFRATPSQNSNGNLKFKLVEATNISPARSVYYDINQFQTATDPANYYATLNQYQSMPSPGAYSAFSGQKNSGSTSQLSRNYAVAAITISVLSLTLFHF